MDTKEFLRLTKQHKCKIVISKSAPFGLTWEQWAKFAEKTGTIDFGCSFFKDANGQNRCAAEKSGCCVNCDTHMSYLEIIPDSKKSIAKIASLFDSEYGFLDSEKGCKLPRKYRSLICLSYSCYSAFKIAENRFSKEVVSYNVNSYPHKHGEWCIWNILRYIESLRLYTPPSYKDKIKYAILSII